MVTFLGSENEGEGARTRRQAAEEKVKMPGLTPAGRDAGQALDTARARDRLDWEDRCESVQRRINRAYALELKGKQAREFAWLAIRGCLVVLLGSCVISWTGCIAMLLTCAAVAILVLGLAGMALGVLVELVSQLRLGSLLSGGERDQLEVYDPSLRPIR